MISFEDLKLIFYIWVPNKTIEDTVKNGPTPCSYFWAFIIKVYRSTFPYTWPCLLPTIILNSIQQHLRLFLKKIYEVRNAPNQASYFVLIVKKLYPKNRNRDWLQLFWPAWSAVANWLPMFLFVFQLQLESFMGRVIHHWKGIFKTIPKVY